MSHWLPPASYPADSDYSIASPDITFTIGSTASQCVEVSITDDVIVEDLIENVILGLSSTSGATVAIETAILTITDNDGMFIFYST